jgi:hypothetical protein
LFRLTEADANRLGFSIDGSTDQIPIYPDKDRSEIEARKHFLVDGGNIGFGYRTGTGDDPADKTPMALTFSTSPTGEASSRSRCLEIVLEAAGEWLMGQAYQGVCQFNMTERPD